MYPSDSVVRGVLSRFLGGGSLSSLRSGVGRLLSGPVPPRLRKILDEVSVVGKDGVVRRLSKAGGVEWEAAYPTLLELRRGEDCGTPSKRDMRLMMSARENLRECEMAEAKARMRLERDPSCRDRAEATSECERRVAHGRRILDAADAAVFGRREGRHEAERELKRGFREGRLLQHESSLLSASCKGGRPTERERLRRSRNVVEVMPRWYVHSGSVTPENCRHVYSYLVSRFLPEDWKEVSKKPVPLRVVTGESGSESLQNLPLHLHARLKICSCLKRKSDVRDALLSLKVPDPYASSLLSVPLRVLAASR